MVEAVQLVGQSLRRSKYLPTSVLRDARNDDAGG